MKESAPNDPRPLITSGFSIAGKDLDPDRCSLLIGMEATEVGHIGEKRRPESLVALRTSFWEISVPKMASDEIDACLKKVIDILWPKRERVMEFLEKEQFDEAGFFTIVSIHADRPLYEISADTLRRLSYFQTSYTIDINDYSD